MEKKIKQYLEEVRLGYGYVTFDKLENQDLDMDPLLRNAMLEDVVKVGLEMGWHVKETNNGWGLVYPN